MGLAVRLTLPTLSLTIRQQHGNRDAGGVCQRQRVQVVALIEGVGGGAGVGICNKACAEEGYVGLAEQPQPAGSARWNEGFKARAGARKTACQFHLQLAAAGTRQADNVLSVVVQQAGNRADRAGSGSEISTQTIDENHGFVAVGSAGKVAGGEGSHGLTVTNAVELNRRRHRSGHARLPAGQGREGLGRQVRCVAG